MSECEACTRWQRCADHDRCDDCCGRDNLVYYREGLLCGRCRRGRVDDRIAAFDGDTDYTDEVTCPHCGHVHTDSWEMDEGEHECDYCERPFEMERIVMVSYSTAKGGAAAERADTVYKAAIAELERLMDADPSDDERINEVAESIAEYEATMFPINRPSPEDAAAFRQDQES